MKVFGGALLNVLGGIASVVLLVKGFALYGIAAYVVCAYVRNLLLKNS